MAKVFAVNINLKGNQLLNAVVHQNAGDPSLAGVNATASKGQIYFDTTAGLLKFYNGSSFVPASGGITVGANTYYSATTFQGTSNQVLVTSAGTTNAGTVTVALPTSIVLNTGGSIGFSGATSGVVTVQAPLVAGTNTLTLPAATDTLVGKATTDTLTNKSLSGSSNTFTNIPNSALVNATITLGSSTLTLGSTTSTVAGLTLSSPTISTILNSSATITLPTATGTLATLSNSETLTNKTLTTASLGSNLAAGGYAITGLANPTNPQDAATKYYVDTTAQGLNVKLSVVVATVGSNITLSGTQTIDGVALTAGQRVLVKDQSTASQNGIYVVASGAWTRATDETTPAIGDFTFVESGSTWGRTGWIVTSASPIVWSQFSAAGEYNAGYGISISGTSIAFNPSSSGGLQTATGGASIKLPANSGLTTDSTGLYVSVGTGLAISGGTISYATGQTTQTASGVSNGNYYYGTQKQVATITGNGSLNSFVINHNLNSQDITVQVYQTSASPDTQYAEVETDIVRTSSSTITVSFSAAPANGVSYNVVMVG
jgi:hypothetical protein